MVRSFHYAALSASLEGSTVRSEDRALAAPWADAWYRWVSAAFVRAYLDVVGNAPLLPSSDDLGLVLDTHLLQKAFYELRDELEACAETVTIPLSAITELVGAQSP